jgi:hypothetical protein
MRILHDCRAPCEADAVMLLRRKIGLLPASKATARPLSNLNQETYEKNNSTRPRR